MGWEKGRSGVGTDEILVSGLSGGMSDRDRSGGGGKSFD